MSEEGANPESELAVRWLEPGEVNARWDAGAARLAVWVARGEEVNDARAAMAFPVSRPGRFIELCDSKGESLGVLRSLKGLASETRRSIEAALEARYLIPVVTHVLDLAERSPFVLRWQVRTDRGERVFFTESSREAVKYQGSDRIRITDLTGSHYDVPSMAELDAASRALLANYL